MKLIAALLLAMLPLFAQTTPVTQSREDSLKVLQFNIWQECTCIEGGFDALVQCIDESGADLVFLQEIRNYDGRRFIPRLVEALALKGKHYYAQDSSCDSGVLSLYPIEEDAHPWEGIGSVHRTVVRAGERRIALYSAHLDYTPATCRAGTTATAGKGCPIPWCPQARL